ncbi:MAG: TIGR03619 family F420-dependent LLM class oxidoreductase [Acidimicrobiales bacterium]|nr:TIGR03619 family F420-dependent LLM class oxidoreductase [Acidimicrobiales bacterium]
MRFTYAETLCDPTYLAPLARAAEEGGFDSFSVPDSLIYPAESATPYPYTPDGDRRFLEDKPMIEPFTLIPWLAAATERIRFTTFVVKAPVRAAVLLAKQAASAAVLSGNRLRLGVGISPWPEDFAALGQPWERRGDRLDETIAVVRGLTAGGWFEHHGELIDIDRMKICPVPDMPIPILVGGHADRALRRAATLGDGWLHGGGDPADLPRLLDRLAELRREAGRADEPFEVHVISLDAYSVDGVRRLEDMGVTDVVVGFRYPYTREPDTESLGDKLAPLRRFADEVIARVT